MSVEAFALGIAADLSKKILGHFTQKKLKGTKVGKALAGLGLLSPEFHGKLEAAMRQAIKTFFAENKAYQNEKIATFFSEKYVAREVGEWLLDGKLACTRFE